MKITPLSFFSLFVLIIIAGMVLASSVVKEDFEDTKIQSWVYLSGGYEIKYGLYQEDVLKNITHGGSYFLVMEGNNISHISNFVEITMLRGMKMISFDIVPTTYKLNKGDISMLVIEFTDGVSSTYLYFEEYSNLTGAIHTVVFYQVGNQKYTLLNKSSQAIWDWFKITYNKETRGLIIGLKGVSGFSILQQVKDILIYGFHGVASIENNGNQIIIKRDWDTTSYAFSLDNIIQYPYATTNELYGIPLILVIAIIMIIGISIMLVIKLLKT